MLFFTIFTFVTFVHFVSAQSATCENPSSLDLDQINKCLDELNQAKSQSEKATKPLEDQVNAISARVNFIEKDLVVKEKNINESYKNLEKQQQTLYATIRDYYIKSYYNSPLLLLLSSNSVSELTQTLEYQKVATDRDKAIITNIVISITNLEQRQKELENEKIEIVVVKEKLDKVVAQAKTYQASLSSQIAKVSARQKEILAQRLASLNIPRSAGTSARGCTDDRGVDPGFSPRLAFFTYGAPHRVGMNQYGAKGRADANQGRDDILRAYYANFEVTKWDTNIKIKVQGQGEFPLEEYALRIYEMPESWPMAALEAQAIAARSFALAYTNNGSGEICTSESCQVFNSNPKTGAWAQAVKNTEGLVMTSGGNPIKAWYASTHGGYVFTSAEVWGGETSYTKHAIDTTTGAASSFDDLKNNAYDKESQWFYCDWGARGDKKTAWLRPSEVADIANVILLAKADSSTGEHLYQTDKPNPAGTETWSEDRVRQELQNKGITPFTNVSDVSIAADFSGGRTASVNVSGNISQSFSGDEFKNWFNLRAPANIQIVGPLYNIE